MKGQRYASIIDKLVGKGRWHITDSEVGYVRLVTWEKDKTLVLEINYDAENIITGVYKYSY